MLLIEELLFSPLFLLSVVILVGFLGWLFAVKKFVAGDKFWRISNFISIAICRIIFYCAAYPCKRGAWRSAIARGATGRAKNKVKRRKNQRDNSVTALEKRSK